MQLNTCYGLLQKPFTQQRFGGQVVMERPAHKDESTPVTSENGIRRKIYFNDEEERAINLIASDFEREIEKAAPEKVRDESLLHRVSRVTGEILGTIIAIRNKHEPLSSRESAFLDAIGNFKSAASEKAQAAIKLIFDHASRLSPRSHPPTWH
jgi:hypothetical protein